MGNRGAKFALHKHDRDGCAGAVVEGAPIEIGQGVACANRPTQTKSQQLIDRGDAAAQPSINMAPVVLTVHSCCLDNFSTTSCDTGGSWTEIRNP